jgi:hypothetical protein
MLIEDKIRKNSGRLKESQREAVFEKGGVSNLELFGERKRQANEEMTKMESRLQG